ISLRKRNTDNKRAEVMIKALETGEDIKVEKLAEALGKPILSQQEQLNMRLLNGCKYTLVGLALILINLFVSRNQDLEIMLYLCGSIALAIGIAYLIVYFATRNQVNNKKES
ncbi:MAG: hypothetical protein K2H72_07655, partial [Muribaculaceae bacterium]|nr:hypothetical protein [Muribaculaceae bacterium]